MARPRRWTLPFLAILIFAAGSLSAQTFVFELRGDQEVPPVPTTATGGCMGVLDQSAGTFDLTCVHNVVGATVMHIHSAPAGANGPIIFDLGDPTSPVTATWSGMTPANIADLLAGKLYVNIHTGGRPGGEIRGQIVSRSVDAISFNLDGAQVEPPVSTASTGTCMADLDAAATGVFVECSHDVPSPTAAHLHDAPPRQNGPLVFDFATAATPFAGTAPLTAQQVASFAAGFLYVDVHSTDAPTGEVRGQVAEAPAAPTTGTIRILKTTFPAGGAGFSFTDDVPGSPGTFTLDDGQIETFAGVASGAYAVTEVDPATSPGGFALTELSCDDADSTVDLATRTAAIALEAGETVTCTFVNTEVPPTADLFVFHLSGDQEVPPVATSARGGCAGIFDAGASELTLLCTHDVAAATLSHIHRGAAGTNGSVVFDLGDPTSPIQATWSGMTPADVADLLAGNLYVNVHTGGRPAGEIRGQILERTVDSVVFPVHGAQVVPPASTSATGSCLADLNDAATQLDVSCTHDVPDPAQAHVHDAPALMNGPIVFTFPSAASPFSGNVPMTPRYLADFAAGFLYVDVHGSVDEIRGQIIAPPSLSIDDVTLDEGNLATTPFTFTITLSSAVTYDVSVTWETIAGTAGEGSDYTGVSPTIVTIPAGDLSATVTVDVSGDILFESDETFTVQLSNPVGATLADAQGAGTIRNDDVQPSIAIGDAALAEGDSGPVTFDFTVTLSSPSGVNVSVDWATTDGSATAGSDYVASVGTLVIPAGSTAGTISVTVNGDATFEPDETFSVQLSNPVGAMIADAEGIGTIQNDDGASVNLSVVKTAPAQAFTGEPVAFTLLVANEGPDAATNVVLTDPLSAEVTFESVVTSQGSCTGTATITCNLGTIASGASATVTLTVTAPATPQDLVNTASVDGAEVDSDPTNDGGSATVEIRDAAEIPVASPMTMALLALALALAGFVAMRRG